MEARYFVTIRRREKFHGLDMAAHRRSFDAEAFYVHEMIIYFEAFKTVSHSL